MSRKKSNPIPKQMRWNVLNKITIVAEALKESKFIIKKNTTNDALAKLKGYFHTKNDVQTMIMCYAVYSFFDEKYTISFSLCADYIGVNVLKLASLNKEFIYLQEKMLIRYSPNQSLFECNEEMIKPILNNVELLLTPSVTFSYQEFVDRVDNVFEIRYRRDMTITEFLCELESFEEQNQKLPFVTRCCKLISDFRIRFFFYECCADFLYEKTTNLESCVHCLWIGNERISIIRSFLEENNILFKAGLIEFETKVNVQDASVVLTEKGKKMFLDKKDYELYSKVDDKKFIQPLEISPVKLFYSPGNKQQIEELTRILYHKNFVQIRNRLGNLSGICVLLYGAPGCGKTETVYQLARKTGRVIVPVDISDTKECWYGQSEKKIRKLFTEYKRICDTIVRSKNGRIPILMINECDAVFSQRKNVNLSNTAQTENAIQNIILEELEKFDGILLATTNLINNLDPAFERRFLIKIQFENPSLEAKRAIWHNKMPWLSKQNANQLASDYNFSGGEISNVVRKCQIKEIICGNKPDINDVIEYCNSEKICNEKHTKIGFTL